MTEMVFASSDTLLKHLSKTFSLSLSPNQETGIRVLYIHDKASLQKILAQLDQMQLSSNGFDIKIILQSRFRDLLARAIESLGPSARERSVSSSSFLSSSQEGGLGRSRSGSHGESSAYESLNSIATEFQDKSLDEKLAIMSDQQLNKSREPGQTLEKHQNRLKLTTRKRMNGRVSREEEIIQERPEKRERSDVEPLPNDATVVGSISPQWHNLLNGVASAGRPIPFAVQFFLIMLVSRGNFTLDDLLSPLDIIRRLANASLSEALEILKSDAKLAQGGSLYHYISEADKKAFFDLEREEASLQEHGNCIRLGSERGSTGGKVTFRGKVVLLKSSTRAKGFSIVLAPPRLAASTRVSEPSRGRLFLENFANEELSGEQFSRRFGSSRFLRLSVDDEALQEKQGLRALLTKDIFVASRRYRVLFVRNNTIFFFQLGQDHPTISTFLDWHGPFGYNGVSLLCKYVQRLALGLSTSLPGLYISPDDIRLEEDIVSPMGNLMTDGAASISEDALRILSDFLGWTRPPSAFQARFAGSKGVWYVEPKNEPGIRITIRDSQLKLKRPLVELGQDPTLCTIDILTPAKVTWPSTLSKQILLVLSNNGVHSKTLEKLQHTYLQTFVEMTSFDLSTRTLAENVDKLASVTVSRNKRQENSRARAVGLASRHEEERAREKEEEQAGLKLSDMERVYEMLLQGFHPREDAFLADLMVSSVGDLMDRAVKKFQIPLQRSVDVLVIPDPVGVLREGEIQLVFNSSRIPIDPDTLRDIYHLQGDVLVTRHPCLTPADIRKVTAVHYKELEKYSNVVIFSTRGDRSLADVLSGGDMDGDTIRVIWEQAIVEEFNNADIDSSKPSPGMRDVFSQDAETVDGFLRGKSAEERENGFVRRALDPLFAQDVKGIYGNLALNSAYKSGCDHQSTVDLAFKFNQSMDASKTGLKIDPNVLKKDNFLYQGRLPEWNDTKGAPSFAHETSIKRSSLLPECILDVLWVSGYVKRDEIVGVFGKEVLKIENHDLELARLWKESVCKNRLSASQQEAILSHVHGVLREHALRWRKYFGRESRFRSSLPQRGSLNATPTPPSSTISDETSREISDELLALYNSWCTTSIGLEIAGLKAKDTLRLSSAVTASPTAILTRPKTFSRSNSSPTASSRLPEKNDNKIERQEESLVDRLTEQELRYYRHLVASCLYATVVENEDRNRRDQLVKVAFSWAWRDLLDLKADPNAAVLLPFESSQTVRLMKQVADL